MWHTFRLRVFNPLVKEVWHAFRLCGTPLLLAIILARANAYSRALMTLHLSGTVHWLYIGWLLQKQSNSFKRIGWSKYFNRAVTADYFKNIQKILKQRQQHSRERAFTSHNQLTVEQCTTILTPFLLFKNSFYLNYDLLTHWKRWDLCRTAKLYEWYGMTKVMLAHNIDFTTLHPDLWSLHNFDCLCMDQFCHLKRTQHI